ncbi:MAG TPA: HlyD family efflux transporter periplasmic adaptor subunit [Telluria sp.]|nr:HlyD family efflux transporter periplasmic adaptor subunit [Telluria sp.]
MLTALSSLVLPPLREELALLPGPALADGQPSHTLHDPVRNQFFQIDWPTFEVLSRWHLGNAAEVAASVGAETTLQMSVDEVLEVVEFLSDNQLLRPAPGSAATLAAGLQKRRGSAWKWLLHNYLFFRLPLLKPDRWLGRWAPRLDWLYSRTFLLLTLGAFAWGAVEVYRQWDRFAATMVDTLSWSGLASYGVALAAVKALHELGHAFTAKRLGCKVPTMGVAFLVLWPVAYTDTNDVWKLTGRRQRLAVVAAGVLTELAVAAWSTLAWALLPEGVPKSLAFLLATTTWVASVAINISPFMRFDGYFLLSDWLEMPNLHARAFALARWDLRERLFGLGLPAPEVFPRARRNALILFAYATWVYRLVVFLGIAALVYAFFIKAVGLLLFAVEIGWFVLLPLFRELAVWRRMWPELRGQARTRRSILLGLVVAALLVVPLPARLSAGALLRPAEQLVIYAPPHARLEALPVGERQHVTAGTVLMKMSSPDLASRRASAAARTQSMRWLATAGAFDKDLQAQWQVANEKLGAAKAEMAAVQADAARYAPVAPFSGVLRDVQPELRPGAWLSADEPLARLVGDGGELAVAYVDEDDVRHLGPGDTAKFYSDSPGGPVVALKVVSIDADATRVLPEPELATLFGGSVVAREKHGELYPERPVYRVTLKPLESGAAAAQHTWRGKVVISGRWTAPALRYVQSALGLFRREAGF